jgi:hypothetical protein
MLISVVPDGFDASDGLPLIRIEGEPEMWVASTRNANGSIDLRVWTRFWKWRMHPHIQYDTSKLDVAELVELLVRAGEQVGIGQGRPLSAKSCGIGYGKFKVI